MEKFTISRLVSAQDTFTCGQLTEKKYAENRIVLFFLMK
jgi:hypothetical protein